MTWITNIITLNKRGSVGFLIKKILDSRNELSFRKGTEFPNIQR